MGAHTHTRQDYPHSFILLNTHSGSVGQVTLNPCCFIKGQYPSFNTFDPPTIQEVHNIILELKNSAPGHDGIKSILIKETIDLLVSPLTHILSLSLQSGNIPHDLKIAKVTPIFKTGNTDNFGNYRPISILPCISKLLEKFVYSRILKHLQENNILHDHQYGFRKKHSTEHALLQLTNIISSAMDQKKFALGVFLDLTKAFDTVNHSILIAKLNRYGVEDIALNWFKNYLLNRQQYVTFNGHSSAKSSILHGVPQGSILGPLLFLIYINDLALSCKYFFPVLFADDTTLIATHNNFNYLIDSVNNDLSSISKWFQLNKLTLNVKKCNFIIFCNINKSYPKDQAKLYINGIEMTQVKTTKFLGILVDERLDWTNHIDLVCKRLTKMMGILRKVCPFIHPSAHLTLYYSFLFPYLNYCNMVWAATSPTHLKK